MKCEKCKSELKPGKKFCGVCGAPAPPEERRCHACNAKLDEGENFCPDCGTKYGGGAKPAKPAPAAKPAAPAATPKVGDIIQFGPYDWRVLDVQGGKALIITDKVIEKRQYHGEYTDLTWADCNLRKYLNGTFHDSFVASDRERIAATKNVNKDNPWYGVAGGVDTTDKVFLLSLEEVVRYFGDSGDLAGRRRKNGLGKQKESKHLLSDQYNDARIAYDSDGNASWWWLRSPGIHSLYAANVFDDGWVFVNGNSVNNSDGGVRPALWLNL
jgi:RNA polymerase subunit RPABC4/transcription elongation factor Spt4